MNRVFPLLILMGTLLAASGCNIVAPVVFAVHGPEKVEPLFKLDAERTTVVFIDDPANKVSQRRLRSEIAEFAQETLLHRDLLDDMIDGRLIITAAGKDRYGKMQSITELGAAVSADVVIYALVTEFTLGESIGAYVPQCSMRVKLLDVKTNKRIWPNDPSGYSLRISFQQRPGEVPTNISDVVRAEEALAARAGLGLAQMFYKHEIQVSVRR